MAYLQPMQRQLGAPLSAPLAMYGDYGTFDGLGAKKKKKKKGFFAKVKRVAKKVGKVALKAAPIVAGLTLGPVGGIAVGAAAGAVGRGKPKLKRILRSAAYGGAAGLVRTGQAGRILVKGAKVAGRLAKGGARIVGKVGRGAGGLIENIAKGDIGPGEGAVIGAGGGLIYKKRKKKKRPQMPDEPLTPEESGPAFDEQAQCIQMGGIWTRSGCVMTGTPRPADIPEVFEPTPTPTLPENGGPVAPMGPEPEPQTPLETQLPTAGGTLPKPAADAMYPGAGTDTYRPSMETSAEAAEGTDAAPKPNVALLLAAGVAVLILLNKKKGR